MPAFRFLLPAAFLAIAGLGLADETSDKQKKAAVANLKKADIAKGNVAESETVIVGGLLAEARLKALGDSLTKTSKLARKALQFGEKDEPWKGKLTVMYLPERTNFTSYMRLVVGKRVEGNYDINIRSDEPTVVIGADLDAKATDSDILGELGPVVAGAWLQAKVGSAASIPSWVRLGLGRAIAYRAEGTASKRFTGYKARAARPHSAAAERGCPIADVWGSDRADGLDLATSLMDYLAFGPKNGDFGKFISALRPDENGDAQAVAKVLEDAGWKTLRISRPLGRSG
ncbi:MAG: hypothetical protein U0791_21185 [Gemmataceae bacterium]